MVVVEKPGAVLVSHIVDTNGP